MSDFNKRLPEDGNRPARGNGGTNGDRHDGQHPDYRVPARIQTMDVEAYPVESLRFGGYPVPFGTEAQEDTDGGLFEYWRLLRARKGTLVLICSIGLLAGLLVTLPQTPIYQAKTTLEVLELNQNFMNMKDVQQLSDSPANLMTDIQTQIRILQSDSLVDRVTGAMTNGAATESPKNEGRVTAWRRALNLPEPDAVTARDAAVEIAKDSLKVRASGQTRIIEITVDSTEPAIASEFANKLTNEYIEQAMESRWKSSQRTGEWLTRQLDDMRIKLERSEDALQAYARKSELLFTGENTNVSEAKLQQLQEELTKVQADRVAKQSRYEMAKTAPVESLPDVLNHEAMQAYTTKMADLRREREDLLSTYTPEHQKTRRVDAQIASLQASLEKMRTQIVQRIRNEYEEAARKERLLEGDYGRQTRLVTSQGEKAIHYNILKREVDTNRQLYEAMLQRVKEASLASALRASNVRIVDAAKPPRFPYKPKIWLNGLLGLLAGGFFGIAYIVATERADRTLQDPADVQHYLSLPELGVIPNSSSLEGRKRSLLGRYAVKDENKPLVLSQGLPERLELVTFQRKPSPMAESFRATLTSVLFAGQNGQQPRALVVTSANPGEGKTTVATNLAIAIAEAGQRILLIDADTRRPRAHDVFELSNSTGLTTLLRESSGTAAERARWASENVIHSSAVPNLDVMPAGPGVAGPTNLLYAKHWPAVLDELKRMYDMVVIDTPPMLQIPDARVMGRLVNGIVLVVRAGKTTRDAAVAAQTRLKEDGIRVFGIVMNDWDAKRSATGYHSYYSAYSNYYEQQEG